MKNKIIAQDLLKQIAKEKAKRRDELIASMRKENPQGFWNFCKYLYPNFFKDEQTERIRYADVLQKCIIYSLTGDPAYKKYRKVMINIFPRFGKSFMVSILVVWALWHYPEGAVMRNTHDATLAEKFSRDIRNMIESPNAEGEIEEDIISVAGKLNAIAPELKLSRDKRALSSWALKTSKDVAYFCAGIAGSITGKGCDLAMILDDPIKSPEAAYSANFNEDLLTWYLTVHRSRADIGENVYGCEIIIMARWSEDDLCSRLLDSEDDWYQVTFDIENEEGNSSCESIISTEKMQEIKRGFANTARLNMWNALYRQKVEGMNERLFKKEDLMRFDPAEYNFTDCRRYQVVAWCDVADEGTDSLSMPIGYWDMGLGEVYIVDVLFTKERSEISRKMVADKILEHRIELAVFESNNGGKYFAELCSNSLTEKNNEMRARISQLQARMPTASEHDKIMFQSEIDRLKDTIFDGFVYEALRTSANKITKILVNSSLVLSSVYFIEDALIDKSSDYAFFMRELYSFQKERRNLHDDAADSVCSLAKRFCASNLFEMF